jgi:hypothetical protein
MALSVASQALDPTSMLSFDCSDFLYQAFTRGENCLGSIYVLVICGYGYNGVERQFPARDRASAEGKFRFNVMDVGPRQEYAIASPFKTTINEADLRRHWNCDYKSP